MFIDTADHYGLADLHQLRGRVGRYKNRAYCYLLVEKHKHITPEAARRLRAIEEFSNMGAGFAIAMRDLEFRGAGNVLGTQQSGHIAAVGYELYCQLLETAVRRLKKMPPKLSIDVNIDLPGEAFLPDDYVPDLRMKIDLYRRISRVVSAEDIAALIDECRDRFGEPPTPVYRLLELAELKMEATLWSIHTVRLETQDERDYLFFDFTDRSRLNQLARNRAEPVRFVNNQTACVPLGEAQQGEDALALARRLLRHDV
jgi:transcription-repair coupling factor (superfamily II helicase)